MEGWEIGGCRPVLSCRLPPPSIPSFPSSSDNSEFSCLHSVRAYDTICILRCKDFLFFLVPLFSRLLGSLYDYPSYGSASASRVRVDGEQLRHVRRADPAV